ncbi:Uncharacterised protein [Vibrio cholerae]|nr:Uncharacterised protein [Vibrio cholerae]CSD81436.1 Uncharacterised protein [Vibrio cholerae]CSI90625.1 Uncharacterised protein [Vibrio cholerae]
MLLAINQSQTTIFPFPIIGADILIAQFRCDPAFRTTHR